MKKTIPFAEFAHSDYTAVRSWLNSQIHDMIVDEEFMEAEDQNILPQLRGLAKYLLEKSKS